MNAGLDAAVVGAGPAGCAAAILLAGRGFRVAVLEKDHFPRRKVCGAFLSAGARPLLLRLGAAADVARAGPEQIGAGSVHLPSGVSAAFELPVPGLGISRFALDALLAARAAQAGADLRFGSRVAGIERGPSGFRLRLAGGEELVARVTIGAWGRWDSLDRSLGRNFLGLRQRYLGWSAEYEGESAGLRGRVNLYVFDGGYCGLSRVEGGRTNLAGVIAERAYRRLGAGWEAVAGHARRSNARLEADLHPLHPTAGYLGTGPIFFTAKPPVENGILLAGDSAGVLDPFSGEGQASALASGALAADTAATFLDGGIAAPRLAGLYAAAWRSRFRRRFTWSAVFRRLMLHPSLGGLAGRVAGPALTRLAVRALAGSSSAGA